MKKMVKAQDYPHDKMEWIIMDDSPESSSELFEGSVDDLDGIQVRYIYLKDKVPLAEKRDLLSHTAKGVILVNMDDDDYYPPCRVSHAVETLLTKGTELAGTSKMYMYFSCNKTIYQFGPYRDNHGTAATLAYTKNYACKHNFYNPKGRGKGHYSEESVFCKNWKQPMAQLDPIKTILALSHADNTIDKTVFIEKKSSNVHKTPLTLDHFINKTAEAEVYDFYHNLERRP